MDVDTTDIVKSIVRVCEQGGIQVSDILAAFIAKTVIEKDSAGFALELEMTPESTKKVIIKSVERLLERDSPSLETMKMQIEYDTSFQKNDNEAQKILRLRNKMVASHKMAITDVEMDEANDFEALTTLYRKIFRFLLDFAPNASSTSDRSIEREVAAALESVFPRIGLKEFVQLGIEEKGAQLLELARIILGIRLFNKDQGRGGVDIEDVDKESTKMASSCAQLIDQEVDFFVDACGKYQKAIVRALLDRRKHEIDCANELKRLARLEDAYKADDKNDTEDPEGQPLEPDRIAEAKTAKAPDAVPTVKAELVSSFLVDRWSEELTNRRQYLGFLRILQDEVQAIQDKVIQLCEIIQQELVTLRSLVGNKASVPKEVVYPRFDSLGSTWIELFQQFTILKARNLTLQSLSKFRLSFNPTLVERFYADKPKPTTADRGEKLGDTAKFSDSSFQGTSSLEAQAKTDETEWRSFQSLVDTRDSKDIPFDPSDTPATLLTAENTTDFMLLPLELQGFCPWTMVHARGLLVPGKPTLGVIRYENMYFVCDHDAGIRAFVSNPKFYLDSIKEKVRSSPEYIHLLRVQSWFPGTSIARLMDQAVDGRSTAGADGKTGFGGKPSTKDASTDTPVHFVERHIDNSYHWNEWELRRRALQVVNLRNCVTTGQQSDTSHFRRDNQTQVYEQRAKDSQTRREKGTNPPIVTTYMAGLRGRAGLDDSVAVSKYVRETADAKSGAKASVSKSDRGGARIMTLTLDL